MGVGEVGVGEVGLASYNMQDSCTVVLVTFATVERKAQCQN